MAPILQSCAVGVGSCNDAVDHSAILIVAVIAVLVILTVLIAVGVRRFTK